MEAKEYVTLNYEKCRTVNEFCRDPKNKEFSDANG